MNDPTVGYPGLPPPILPEDRYSRPPRGGGRPPVSGFRRQPASRHAQRMEAHRRLTTDSLHRVNRPPPGASNHLSRLTPRLLNPNTAGDSENSRPAGTVSKGQQRRTASIQMFFGNHLHRRKNSKKSLKNKLMRVVERRRIDCRVMASRVGRRFSFRYRCRCVQMSSMGFEFRIRDRQCTVLKHDRAGFAAEKFGRVRSHIARSVFVVRLLSSAEIHGTIPARGSCQCSCVRAGGDRHARVFEPFQIRQSDLISLVDLVHRRWSAVRLSRGRAICPAEVSSSSDAIASSCPACSSLVKLSWCDVRPCIRTPQRRTRSMSILQELHKRVINRLVVNTVDENVAFTSTARAISVRCVHRDANLLRVTSSIVARDLSNASTG